MVSNAVRKFNRFELKYLVTIEMVEKLKKEILKYAVPDNYNGQGSKYGLASLYYDSPNFKYYWEKIDGLRFRRKLRIRWYRNGSGLSPDSIVYLEIKQRVDRVTQKKRAPVKYKDALLFCREGVIPEHDPRDSALIEEMYEMIKKDRLEPKMVTVYDREAFVGTKYDLGFRLTFDRHLAYRYRNLDLRAENYDGFMLPPNYSIMEIKTNERLPYWVTEMVSRNNLNLIRVSKYCQGLDTANLVK